MVRGDMALTKVGNLPGSRGGQNEMGLLRFSLFLTPGFCCYVQRTYYVQRTLWFCGMLCKVLTECRMSPSEFTGLYIGVEVSYQVLATLSVLGLAEHRPQRKK